MKLFVFVSTTLCTRILFTPLKFCTLFPKDFFNFFNFLHFSLLFHFSPLFFETWGKSGGGPFSTESILSPLRTLLKIPLLFGKKSKNENFLADFLEILLSYLRIVFGPSGTIQSLRNRNFRKKSRKKQRTQVTPPGQLTA